MASSLENLVNLMSRTGHLCSQELSTITYSWKGCVKSKMVSLSDFAQCLQEDVVINWVESLPTIADGYREDGEFFIMFYGEKIDLNVETAASELKSKMAARGVSDEVTAKNIYVPATILLKFYKKYIGGALNTKLVKTGFKDIRMLDKTYKYQYISYYVFDSAA